MLSVLEQQRKDKLSQDLLFYLLLIERLLSTESSNVRRFIYRRAIGHVMQMEASSKSAIKNQIIDAFKEGYQKDIVVPSIISKLVSESDSYLRQAYSSTRTFVSNVLRGKEPVEKIQEIYRSSASLIDITSKVRNTLRNYVLDKSVSIRGRSFNLEYYNSLVSFQKTSEAYSQGVIERAQDTTHLVRVSSEPSLNGDFCDEFAGKIFTTNPNSSLYEYVGDLPNGCCPFHPWCRHTLEVFDPGEYSQEALDKMSTVRQDMLGKKQKELVKNWYGISDD